MTSYDRTGKVPHMGNGTPDGADLLTTREVSTREGWSVTSINRWAAAGVLPSRKLPGRTGTRLFDPADVARFRATREEEVAS